MNTAKNGLTLDHMTKGIAVTAHAVWYANRDEETKAKGIEVSSDLRTAQKWLTAQTVIGFNKFVPDSVSCFDAIAKAGRVKPMKRVIQFVNAVHSGNYKELDLVTTHDLLAAATGTVSREGLRTCATGKGDENSSDQVKNLALARKLRTVLGSVSPGSESTQFSRTFGVNGFARYLKLGQMGKDEHGNKLLTINTSHPLFIAVAKMIETATDETLIFAAESKKRGKK